MCRAIVWMFTLPALTACSMVVKPILDVKPISVSVKERQPLHVAVQVAEETRARVYKHGPADIGGGFTAEFEITPGETLEDVMVLSLSRVFDRISVVRAAPEGGKFDAVMIPDVTDIKLEVSEAIRNVRDLYVVVRGNLRVVDASSTEIARFEEEAQQKVGLGAVGFGSQTIVRDASGLAISQAIGGLIQKWLEGVVASNEVGTYIARLRGGPEKTTTVSRVRPTRLELQTEPNARITIDGVDRGIAGDEGGFVLEAEPGVHEVLVSKEGYEPWRETMSLAAGALPIKRRIALAPLRRAPPAIRLVFPSLDEPVTEPDVALRLEIETPHRLSKVVVIAGGTSLVPTLMPDPTSALPGARFVAALTVPLAEGNNAVRVQAIDQHGTEADQTFTLTRRTLVALELIGPPKSEVRINEQRHSFDAVGTLALRLPPGAYRIEVSQPGFDPWQETVELKADQRSLRRRVALTPARPTSTSGPISDPDAPKISLNYPPAEAKIDREQILIVGLVTDNVGVDRVTITVNGAEVAQARDIAVSGKGYPIRAPAALIAGENIIEVMAADKAGNVTQVVRTVTRVAPAIASPPPPKVAKRWAVVIGIGDYEHNGIPKLRYATRDAEAMYQFLTAQGGYPKDHVLLFTDNTPQKPTLLNIKRALGEFLARRAGRDDMVLIYFAGHGAPEIDVGGIESDGLSKYLIPRDGDPSALYTTALPMDEIQKIFTRIQAERVVMLLDTCYSGTAGGRTFARTQVRASGLNDQFLERLTRSRGRVIMTASGPNEVAMELPSLGHGLFTYYVLEGLRGKADRNGDGIVTVSELYEYVEDQVANAARLAGGRQRPLMKGEIEGALPLSKTTR